MNLSAIHKAATVYSAMQLVVCDIGGYEFVSYSQVSTMDEDRHKVVCDIGGYEFVSYSQAQYLSVKEYDGCL